MTSFAASLVYRGRLLPSVGDDRLKAAYCHTIPLETLLKKVESFQTTRNVQPTDILHVPNYIPSSL
jgi:hypothetical protein